VRIGGDFLVIGSGIAGLRAAITLAASGDVIILTKADPRESNTGYAQGGIAAAFGPDDSPELHAQDTLAAGELASRDLVSRAIVQEARRTAGPIYLTLAHLEASYVRSRFPTIAAVVREAGLDLATDRIPVSPAAHYAMGGIETDLDGRTSIAALFAAGEAACTGVHGANRLASNSLLEGLVFGARAAAAMTRPIEPPVLFATVDPVPAVPAASTRVARVPAPGDVRDLMWQHVGLVRSRDGLTDATRTLSAWRDLTRTALAINPGDDGLRRVASLVTVGVLIAHAARRREESRGGHFRSDFPQRDDIHWQKHLADVRGT
jgi:L-aspartate oxidase